MTDDDYLVKYFEEKDKLRENILKLSREIVKDCAMLIRKTHKNESINFESVLNKLKELSDLTKNHDDFKKYLDTPQQEFVEARVFYTIISEDKLLKYSDFEGIKKESYILGLCDVVGELRRSILDAIKNDDKEKAEKYFGYMENIYDFIMKFDYYHVIDGLRRKQDISRSLLERTHGDIINFIENLKLRKELSKFKK
ncbi:MULTISPECIES: translin family protein [Methanothermococcus]|jgi:translin|uniref:haloacid dehalogenase n=1 Tax=Methanothermococcus TaxID=155862 RepID=UPI0004775B33|nr:MULTISPECIES: haloacid dehalogenase [Methanothermococcus]